MALPIKFIHQVPVVDPALSFHTVCSTTGPKAKNSTSKQLAKHNSHDPFFTWKNIVHTHKTFQIHHHDHNACIELENWHVCFQGKLLYRCLQLTFLLQGSIFNLLVLSTGTNIAMNMMAEGCVSAPECQTPLNRSWIISIQCYAMNHGITIGTKADLLTCTKCTFSGVLLCDLCISLWLFRHHSSVINQKTERKIRLLALPDGKNVAPTVVRLRCARRFPVGVQDTTKSFWYPCLKAENQSVNTFYLKQHVGNCNNKNMTFLLFPTT